MTRLLFFAAGLVAGAALAGGTAYLSAEAATAEHREQVARPRLPGVAPEPQFFEQLCAPGFRNSPEAGGRYTCNKVAATLCPKGASPVNLKLYREGSAAGDTRLLYECRLSETLRPRCGRGFVAAAVRLYRSGAAPGDARLLYECVRYRSGSE